MHRLEQTPETGESPSTAEIRIRPRAALRTGRQALTLEKNRHGERLEAIREADRAWREERQARLSRWAEWSLRMRSWLDILWCGCAIGAAMLFLIGAQFIFLAAPEVAAVNQVNRGQMLGNLILTWTGSVVCLAGLILVGRFHRALKTQLHHWKQEQIVDRSADP